MSHLIMGIDEVGRGPIAGPLVIGACILPPRYDEDGEVINSERWQEDLTDSKRLSEKMRGYLSPRIRRKCLACGLGWVPAEELDELGITNGLKVAARRAVANLREKRPDVHFDEIIIDGITNFLEGTEYEDLVTTVIKADLDVKEVSAASIIAKVARDKYMCSLPGKELTRYEFARHKGYGTKLHWECLDAYGPCPEHRWCIRRISKEYAPRPAGVTTRAAELYVTDEQRAAAKREFGQPNVVKNTTKIGQAAEGIMADFLEREKGHKILSRNFKRKNCEIDIVSATEEHIYFTEVKYRSSEGTDPLETIDQAKLNQMHFTVEVYLRELSKKLQRPIEDLPSPILAVGTIDGDEQLGWFELLED